MLMFLVGGIYEEKSFPGLFQLQVREGGPTTAGYGKKKKKKERNTGWEKM